jgi:hypothetical protein
MGLDEAREIEARFEHYVDGLASVIGHADRVGPSLRLAGAAAAAAAVKKKPFDLAASAARSHSAPRTRLRIFAPVNFAPESS